MRKDIRQKQASKLASKDKIYINSQRIASLKTKIKIIKQYNRGLKV